VEILKIKKTVFVSEEKYKENLSMIK